MAADRVPACRLAGLGGRRQPFGNRTHGGRPPASEGWAGIVGGVLQVAGVSGFLTNRQEVYASAEAEGWRTLLGLWWENYGDQRVGVDQLFALAARNKRLGDLRAGRTERRARTAMGMELAHLRDRVIGEFRVRDAKTLGETGGAIYHLEKSSGLQKGSGG